VAYWALEQGRAVVLQLRFAHTRSSGPTDAPHLLRAVQNMDIVDHWRNGSMASSEIATV